MILLPKIKDLVLICLIFLNFPILIFSQNTNSEFITGADQPDRYLPMLQHKTVIVATNATGLIIKKSQKNSIQDKPKVQSIVDFLVENKINIKSIFAPEHGFRGNADAGETVKNGIDQKTNIPIISLYGKNKKPTADQLNGVDVIVFDIQDVGVRFYTYISTLTYIMEAAAENKVEVIVLDRPNPHDGYIDGPILDKKWTSFVGMHPVPVIYGLTIGEYGLMVNGEKWLEKGVQAKYHVITMQNYHKKKRYPILEKPSPNLPNDKAINLYPSLCFFEGTQVSVGRGTALPFQIFGSPWTKDFPFRFTPRPTEGAKDPFLNGQTCYGEDLSHNPKTLTKLNLEWLLKAYRDYKNPEQDFFLPNLFFDKLAGSDRLRKQIIAGKSEEEIVASWKSGLKKYQQIRKKYVLYPD